MQDVYYGGSKAQWDALQIRTGNAPLRSATIHFDYGADKLAAPTVKIANVSNGIQVTWNAVSGSPRYKASNSLTYKK